MNSAAILYPKGQYNPGGISKIYYALKEDVATFPTLADPETATTLASLVEYDDAITMKTGKQFQPLYCTLETGELKVQMVGPRDGHGFESSGMGSFPGNTSDYLGLVAYGANTEMIFLVKEKNGKVRVVGDLDNPAEIDTVDNTSGVKISDARASKFTFKASSSTPAPVYTTDIADLLVAAS